MAYTSTQLISRAYTLAGVNARGLQTTSGDQVSEGLFLLNAILDVKTADKRLIPYYTVYNFTAVVDQEKYFIPNLVTIETFTFFIGPIRYSMQQQQRKRYFGSPRVNNIQSLPMSWHVERCFGGANLYIYFLPNLNYPLEITGKFSLGDVSLGQDLSLSLDGFYIEYLRYALAEQIASEYNIKLTDENAKKLRDLEYTIIDVSPIDLSMTKVSSLQLSPTLNYAIANLSNGWI